MKQFTLRAEALTKLVELEIRKGLAETGKSLVNRVKSSMGIGTGREVKIKGVVHRRSLPGQPPAKFSNRLHDSITFHTDFGDKSSIGSAARSSDAINKPSGAMGGHVVSVGSNVPYALTLEKGRNPKNARPYLWPALKMSREDIKKAFTRV